MKILVLGGGGFIGSHLCDALLLAGHQVRVFEYPGIKPLCPEESLRHIEWMEGDFTNPVQVDHAVQGCEIIYHLISTTLPKTSNDNPVYDVESNVISTLQMLQSACRHQVRKIIFASSGGTVYGIPQHIPITEAHPTNPISSYGISKLAIEKYLHLFHALHGVDYCVLRLANPYGERQRVSASQGAVAVFLHKALHDEPIQIWGDGSVTRDYIYIADVISAMLKAMQYQGEQPIFNVGAGVGTSLNQMLADMERILGKTIQRVYLPSRDFDVPTNILDIQRSQQSLDWSPQTDFITGLERTLSGSLQNQK
ncbi:MAG: NAD-dependent epimerase/dehydratase family protein [Sulfuricellaceae bacterium]|nr:NAD-dependent epimerase/dehydratase family protein [Sulfuricellaceae bacterium]